MHRAVPLALAFVLAMGAPYVARADAIEACVSSATSGQRLQRAAKLRDARAKFLECVRPDCPAEVKAVCDRLLSVVEADTPTMILSARTSDGQDVIAARVLADGAPLLDSLDGKAIAMDPGPHVLRFERAGGAPIELRVVIREGEKNRLVAVTFPPPVDQRAGEEPSPGRPTPLVVYVLAGVGVVSLAAFAYLAVHGQSQYNDCTPHACPPSTVDALTVDRYLAFGALGVGLASLGAATYFWVTRPERSPQHLTFGLAPAPSGGGLWVRGAF